MAPDQQQTYAFRCRNCGALEDLDNLGDRDRPGACRVCGRGVGFDPDTGAKEYRTENWELLAELSPADQKALAKDRGFAVTQIVAPPEEAANTPPTGRVVAVDAEDVLGSEDSASA